MRNESFDEQLGKEFEAAEQLKSCEKCMKSFEDRITQLTAIAEKLVSLIKQQRWHFSDVEWENLMNRVQRLIVEREKEVKD